MSVIKYFNDDKVAKLSDNFDYYFAKNHDDWMKNKSIYKNKETLKYDCFLNKKHIGSFETLEEAKKELTSY